MRVCVAVVVLLASVVLGNPCREACAFKVCCWARVLAKMSDASHSTCIPFRGWIFFFRWEWVSAGNASTGGAGYFLHCVAVRGHIEVATHDKSHVGSTSVDLSGKGEWSCGNQRFLCVGKSHDKFLCTSLIDLPALAGHGVTARRYT